MSRILHVVGARPNFPKVAPIMAAMVKRPEVFEQVLVHTGQHYDYNMSQVFFEHLEMPTPDEYLKVGSGSHAVQTAQVMTAFEPVVIKHRPDWVMVVGDVNSTLACTLVCSKLGVRVAHVEAGLRSFDRTMPEEINRMVTDRLSDLLFTPSRDADENLIREGTPPERIHLVGNVMIDTVVKMLPRAEKRNALERHGLAPRNYVLVTLHRPVNVDQPQTLREILSALRELAGETPVLFPVHPRTAARIRELDGIGSENLKLVEPLGYLDFVALMKDAGVVLTDSGGVQEETTFLKVPCVTIRPNTERPVTINQGTNRLTTASHTEILAAAHKALRTKCSASKCPELWDGKTASRIADIMEQW